MNYYHILAAYTMAATLAIAPLASVEKDSVSVRSLPEDMQKIMYQSKYEHAIWGLYVKDLNTGEVLYDLNSDKLFSPASTTKLFSVAALINTFGDDYRFKTPVYADGKIKEGKLQGNLIIVGQGDLTFGGRQPNADTIAYTKMDHITANEVPGTILTKEDPLKGIHDLAKQVYEKGLREVDGDIIIDDSLFETIEKRGTSLSPIMINENLIDIVLNPASAGESAKLTWRPRVPGYTVSNQVMTVNKDDPVSIEVSSDESGKNILVKGSLPVGQKDLVRTSAIKDAKGFVRAAFIQALINLGVKVNPPKDKAAQLAPLKSYEGLQQVALWTSPPLSEYAKLILKVSHNTGANLVPLLLASHEDKKTFDEGMRLIGDFILQNVKLSDNNFVLIDGAGGNENRLSPKGEVQLLEYEYKQNPTQFKHYFDALPILGVDGSLEDFAKNTQAVGKVHAKPGTGVALNTATGKFFLITQALGGYVEGKNGRLFAYMIAVNNGEMPQINDIFAIFEDEGQLSSMIYDHTDRN